MLTRAKRAVLCILILASAAIIIIVMTLISVPYLDVLLLIMCFCTVCSIEIAFLSVTFRPTDSSIRVASFLARSVRVCVGGAFVVYISARSPSYCILSTFALVFILFILFMFFLSSYIQSLNDDNNNNNNNNNNLLPLSTFLTSQ